VNRTVGGTTTSYIWDAGSALPVVSQETTAGQTTYYVYGLDMISTVQGATATYYLTDGLGSTTQLTDGAGAVAGAYTYDAFGSVRSHSGSATEWSFTGEQNDPTGLEYLRARYYEPAVGRFPTRDPFTGFIAGPQSQNPYTYKRQRPC
jgi:RHS repeat-associated protein